MIGKVGMAVLRVRKIWIFVTFLSLTTHKLAGDFISRCLGHVGLILILLMFLEGYSPVAESPNTTQTQK
jgi:hypothetical protein